MLLGNKHNMNENKRNQILKYLIKHKYSRPFYVNNSSSTNSLNSRPNDNLNHDFNHRSEGGNEFEIGNNGFHSVRKFRCNLEQQWTE